MKENIDYSAISVAYQLYSYNISRLISNYAEKLCRLYVYKSSVKKSKREAKWQMGFLIRLSEFMMQ